MNSPNDGRRRRSGATIGSWVVSVAFGLAAAASAAEPRIYRGCCDASAAAALNDQVLAVASDEENVLRLYRRDADGPPIATWAAPWMSGTGSGRSEMDLEGAARLGDMVYWIGSHSRNSDGKLRPARHVLFATRVVGGGAGLGVRLEAAGRPYYGLVAALSKVPDFRRYDFGRAAQRAGEAEGGLNIEALAAGAEGSLWIGFRNPVPERKALLIRLSNPGEVIGGAAARWGAALLVPLGGLGLRDAVRAGNDILLVAGPADGGGKHRLYRWSEGAVSARELPGVIPRGFQAESLVVVENAEERRVEILSDDGGEKVAGERCSESRDFAKRAFRGLTVSY